MLSLSHYTSGKAARKFENIWIRCCDTLVYVREVRDVKINKNNAYQHLFTVYEVDDNTPLPLRDFSWTPRELTDKEFERLWVQSIAFPAEGFVNLYNLLDDTYLATHYYKYLAIGDSKYKRGAIASCYKNTLSFNLAEGIHPLVNTLLNIEHESAITETSIKKIYKKVNNVGFDMCFLFNLTMMRSLYFPRYDFVDLNNIEKTVEFFSKHKQVMFSKSLRGVRINNNIMLFAFSVPIGIFSKNGFMVKEDTFGIFQKDLLEANIPFIVHKRLIRNNTICI